MSAIIHVAVLRDIASKLDDIDEIDKNYIQIVVTDYDDIVEEVTYYEDEEGADQEVTNKWLQMEIADRIGWMCKEEGHYDAFSYYDSYSNWPDEYEEEGWQNTFDRLIEENKVDEISHIMNNNEEAALFADAEQISWIIENDKENSVDLLKLIFEKSEHQDVKNAASVACSNSIVNLALNSTKWATISEIPDTITYIDNALGRSQKYSIEDVAAIVRKFDEFNAGHIMTKKLAETGNPYIIRALEQISSGSEYENYVAPFIEDKTKEEVEQVEKQVEEEEYEGHPELFSEEELASMSWCDKWMMMEKYGV
jgi:hypothetical protein